MSEPAIRFHHVNKKFKLTHGGPGTVLEQLLSIVDPRHRGRTEELWAIKDAHFDVMPGETVGFVGRNGSGKSTLLKLATRIYEPTSGYVTVRGRASALLELGTGFHPDLSGRENVFLNGALLGLSRDEIRQNFDSIVDFSELEKFIDMPVKHYSSGMYMRLAFSVAVHVNPDVLFVDEILSVGDQAFQSKCIDRIFDIKQAGTTIIIVSHDLRTMQNLCSRLIWLRDGETVIDDIPQRVLAEYEDYSRAVQEEQHEALQQSGRSFNRWGTREVEIEAVRLRRADGRESKDFSTGDPLSVDVHYRVNEPVEEAQFGLSIFRWDGTQINAPFTHHRVSAGPRRGVLRYHIDHLPLRPSSYFISVSVHDEQGLSAYDYHDRAYPLLVSDGANPQGGGLLDLEARWERVDEAAGEPVAEK